jgi:hypothetical protein
VGNSTIWCRSKLWRRGCQVQTSDFITLADLFDSRWGSKL